VKDNGAYTAADDTKPSMLRARLRAMPEIEPGQLYPNQITAIANLEHCCVRPSRARGSRWPPAPARR